MWHGILYSPHAIWLQRPFTTNVFKDFQSPICSSVQILHCNIWCGKQNVQTVQSDAMLVSPNGWRNATVSHFAGNWQFRLTRYNSQHEKSSLSVYEKVADCVLIWRRKQFVNSEEHNFIVWCVVRVFKLWSKFILSLFILDVIFQSFSCPMVVPLGCWTIGIQRVIHGTFDIVLKGHDLPNKKRKAKTFLEPWEWMGPYWNTDFYMTDN